MKLRIRLATLATTATFLLAYTTATLAQSGSLLQITSPIDGIVVSPGQTVTIVVAAAPGTKFGQVAILPEGPLGSGGLVQGPPFSFSLQIPKVSRFGSHGITALAINADGSLATSNAVHIDVEPAQPPAQLLVEPMQMVFDFSGEQVPLNVKASMADGTIVDVTGSPLTSYSSSDSTVATSDLSGLITATGGGTATIAVSYASQTAKVTLRVPTTVPGDLNGDGKVDQDDINILLDALGTAASGPFDARDLNRDGVIDASDVAALVKLCTHACSFPDLVPPRTTASVSPPPDAAGWNKSDVTISLNAVDDPGGSGVAAITYNSRGAQGIPSIALKGASAALTVGTEGISLVSFFATDQAGNSELVHSVTVKFDKTPPEAFNQFDPQRRDIALFGRDSLSGVAPGPLTPVSVVRKRKGEDSGDHMAHDGEDHDRRGSHDDDDVDVELRTYKILDAAGNSLQLVEEVTRSRHEESATLISLQYNDGPVIAAPRNRMRFHWETDDGSLEKLEQELTVESGNAAQIFTANFNEERNRTIIERELPRPEARIVKPGLALLRMATVKSKLILEF
ncbi:MAG TPA: dockerin type I domain-containing protein [Candidatus Angelobacter sp.]|nr:dockerin type I domain-containing protein [Candidatus Angelobacter sp.]